MQGWTATLSEPPGLQRGAALKHRRVRIGGRRTTRAQGLTEFALVLPILIVILATAIDAGRVFYSWVNLTSAARVGAAHASGDPDAAFGAGSEYASRVLADRADSGCPLNPGPDPAPPTFPSGTDVGDLVTVSLTCDFHPAMPLVAAIIGDPVPVTATVNYPIKAGVVSTDPTPLPTPTPTPTPTPEPTCLVPNLIGLVENTDGIAAWTTNGFDPAKYKSVGGPPGFTIQFQSQVSDTFIPCTSQVTVRPNP
jgi:hypothetical protein